MRTKYYVYECDAGKKCKAPGSEEHGSRHGALASRTAKEAKHGFRDWTVHKGRDLCPWCSADRHGLRYQDMLNRVAL